MRRSSLCPIGATAHRTQLYRKITTKHSKCHAHCREAPLQRSPTIKRQHIHPLPNIARSFCDLLLTHSCHALRQCQRVLPWEQASALQEQAISMPTSSRSTFKSKRRYTMQTIQDNGSKEVGKTVNQETAITLQTVQGLLSRTIRTRLRYPQTRLPGRCHQAERAAPAPVPARS